MYPTIFRYPETFRSGAVIGIFCGAIIFSPWNMLIPKWFLFSAFALFGLIFSYDQMDRDSKEGIPKVKSYLEGFLLFGIMIFVLIDLLIKTNHLIATIILSLIISAHYCTKALSRKTAKHLSREELNHLRAESGARIQIVRETAVRLRRKNEGKKKFFEDLGLPPSA